MRIVRLEAENVKRLKAIEISPEGDIIVIGGKNGAGKSSVLDAIAYALGGKQLNCAEPIRRGETKARVEVDLGELVAIRTWTEKGSYLKVSTKDGANYQSPQKVLDKLVGKLAFDPLWFANAKPAEQVDTLIAMGGIGDSLRELDDLLAAHIGLRVDAGRELKRLSSLRDSLPQPADCPDGPVSVSELTEEFERANEQVARRQIAGRALADLETKRNCAQSDADEIMGRYAAKCEEVAVLNQLVAGKEQELHEMRPPSPSLGEISEKLRGAEEHNRRHEAHQHRLRLRGQIESTKDIHDKEEARIEELRRERHSTIEQSPLPIPGLSLGDDVVRLNDTPFDQLSSAEQLRASIAIGMALNPDLRVMLIANGNVLDTESFRILAELAGNSNYQCWVERVDEDGGSSSVFIEEGEIKVKETDAREEPATT